MRAPRSLRRPRNPSEGFLSRHPGLFAIICGLAVMLPVVVR